MPPKKLNAKLSVRRRRVRRSNRSLPGARNGFVMAPSAIGGAVRSMPPQFTYKQSGDARIKVHHRELVADVAGSVAFATTAYAINPGLAATFPWEYMQARLYESYCFDNLTVEYIPMKGSDKDGRVSLAIDFDAADAAPGSMAQVGNYHLQASDRIWNPLAISVDKNDLEKFGVQRYVRAGAVAGTDIKTYDVGNLYVSTIGCADTSSIGTIYLEFDLWLMTPQLDAEEANNVPIGKSLLATQGLSNTNIVGSAPAFAGSLDVTISGTTITFNKIGYYHLSARVDGANISGFAIDPITVTDCGHTSVVLANGNAAMGMAYAHCTSPGQTSSITDIGGGATVSQFGLMISQQESGLAFMLVRNPPSRLRSMTDAIRTLNLDELPLHRRS